MRAMRKPQLSPVLYHQMEMVTTSVMNSPSLQQNVSFISILLDHCFISIWFSILAIANNLPDDSNQKCIELENTSDCGADVDLGGSGDYEKIKSYKNQLFPKPMHEKTVHLKEESKNIKVIKHSTVITEAYPGPLKWSSYEEEIEIEWDFNKISDKRSVENNESSDLNQTQNDQSKQ